MEMKCRLLKKDFTTEDGQKREYHVIQFDLADGSTLDIPVKGDKARLLVMTQALLRNK